MVKMMDHCMFSRVEARRGVSEEREGLENGE